MAPGYRRLAGGACPPAQDEAPVIAQILSNVSGAFSWTVTQGTRHALHAAPGTLAAQVGAAGG
jgi:hypothetical protein